MNCSLLQLVFKAKPVSRGGGLLLVGKSREREESWELWLPSRPVWLQNAFSISSGWQWLAVPGGAHMPSATHRALSPLLPVVGWLLSVPPPVFT